LLPNKAAGQVEFLNNFEQFVTLLSLECEGYNDGEWKEADKKYKEFVDVEYPQYADVMTEEEKRKVANLRGRYKTLKTKHSANNLMNEVGGFLEGVYEEIKIGFE
ncbi:MAG: hypothetical protein HUK15_01315, partial [Bacteroidales bacterium]|nr:hypothetical protein [Bacteroidales bacterium]